YLQLEFLDLICFNVYLEDETKLSNYLYRLQNIAGEKPLVLAEIGLDSQRNGEDEQAKSLNWQIEKAYSSGCAGAMVFAWTDEWHRGGQDIEDWDFGITDRLRRPKAALQIVKNRFLHVCYCLYI
ncbi:MAG: glycosyltransferase, partial [Candidatus Hodarchaeales archaeon]